MGNMDSFCFYFYQPIFFAVAIGLGPRSVMESFGVAAFFGLCLVCSDTFNYMARQTFPDQQENFMEKYSAAIVI